MNRKSPSIYVSAALDAAANDAFLAGVGDAHVIWPPAGAAVGVLGRGKPDPQMASADIVFGQPDVGQVASTQRIAWVQLTSAGYTAYDRPDVRAAFQARGATLTKSSMVYDDPCALHVLAFMCSHARQLPGAFADQSGAREWPQTPLRARSGLLRGETVVILGYGAIGRRLVQLLAPLHMRVSGIRRTVVGDEGVPTHAFESTGATQALAEADHVINILPASEATEGYFDERSFGALKRGAVFYNIGRGTTVDQQALVSSLHTGHLAAAYLDVTQPEPLPPTHALWTAPNCFITPHTAGGHATELSRLVAHFLDNLHRFRAGSPLLDRVF